MPSRTWIAVAAAGWLIAGIALAQEIRNPHEWGLTAGEGGTADGDGNAEKKDEPAENASQGGSSNISAPISAPPTDRVTAEDYCDTTQERKSTRCRDLAAQERMAFWAIWSVVLTAAGVILIWRTLVQTKRAAIHAGEAAKAAWEGVRWTRDAAEATRATAIVAEAQTAISRDTLLTEQRPWIDMKIRPKESMKYEDHGVTVPTEIITTNLGKTPALDVFVFVKSVCYSSEGNPSIIFKQFCADSLERYKQGKLGASVVFPDRDGDASRNLFIRSDKFPIAFGIGGRKTLMPSLFLCAIYKSSFSDKLHQTGRVFNLFRTGEKYGDGYLGQVIFLDEGDVPRAELFYKEIPGFSFAI